MFGWTGRIESRIRIGESKLGQIETSARYTIFRTWAQSVPQLLGPIKHKAYTPDFHVNCRFFGADAASHNDHIGEGGGWMMKAKEEEMNTVHANIVSLSEIWF